MTTTLFRLGAVLTCAVIASVTAMGIAHAGDPGDIGFDGYPAPSEWDAVIDYLEAIEAAQREPTTDAPPASPVEAPVAPPAADDVSAPTSDLQSRPTRLPNAGADSTDLRLPMLAFVAAFSGGMMLGAAGALRRTGARM